MKHIRFLYQEINKNLLSLTYRLQEEEFLVLIKGVKVNKIKLKLILLRK